MKLQRDKHREIKQNSTVFYRLNEQQQTLVSGKRAGMLNYLPQVFDIKLSVLFLGESNW